jgi:ribosomal protein S3
MAITPRFSRLLPRRLKVKALLEATFAPVPLDRYPVQIANLEVAITIYAAQPVIVAGLVPDFCVEIDEAVEAELYATVVKDTGSSISRIAAPTALTCVGEVGSGRGLRARLTMSEVPRIAEPAPT